MEHQPRTPCLTPARAVGGSGPQGGASLPGPHGHPLPTSTPRLHIAFPCSTFLLQLSLFEIFEFIYFLVWSLPAPLSHQTPIFLQTQSKLVDCFVHCVDRWRVKKSPFSILVFLCGGKTNRVAAWPLPVTYVSGDFTSQWEAGAGPTKLPLGVCLPAQARLQNLSPVGVRGACFICT